MDTIDQFLIRALEHHQAGRLDEAEPLYRQVLAVSPEHPDAWHLLGVIANQRREFGQAVSLIERAIALNRAQPLFHFNLGNAHAGLGQVEEAVANYRQSLALNPLQELAQVQLGLLLQEQGELQCARDCFQAALAMNPNSSETWNTLGNVWNELGDFNEALVYYRRALTLKPEMLAARLNAGNVCLDLGYLDEAEICYLAALERHPEFAEAHNNLGNLRKQQGRVEEAEACFLRSLELNPNLVQAHLNLGNVFKEQGRFKAAHASYERSLELDPEYAEALVNLGNVRRDLGKLEESLACYQQALELEPDLAEAWNNQGNVLRDLGQLDEALACYERALALEPGYRAAHSNYLCAMQYRAGVTLQEIAEASAAFDARHAGPLRLAQRPAFANTANPDRRLKLGFLSPDFGQHPVAFFLIKALENLDSSQFEIVCYNDRVLSDSWTARIQKTATTWREVAGLNDESVAQQICQDQIDILFDLAGHTDGNRLLVFARRPAPIQITWIGHEGTTGLLEMDFILADRHTIPVETEPFYRERVVRMPGGYVCWEPPAGAPEVGPLPALETGFVQFGSLNNPAKVTPAVVKLWAQVLGAVPGSRLLLKYKGFGEESVQARYRKLFAEQGINGSRIMFEGATAYPDYLNTYNQIDIALDPFPFGGAITTCDALWMGVPVVTCAGQTFASRHGLSHLMSAGVIETIASDHAAYVAIAAALAADFPALSRFRARLRDRVAGSALCDGPGFARGLEQVLRGVWADWCSEAR